MKTSDSTHDVVSLLQRLIRFDTTNPPGNEADCVLFIRDLLEGAGIPTQVIAKSPQRPNLITRIPGRGEKPPLMLYGHVDVVTTENQRWTFPPFEGRIANGYLWGRGALDMKGPVAMMLAALLKLQDEQAELPGEVLFVALADEEDWGDFGAAFLVKEHPDLFQGVRFALGEFGGFSLELFGQRFYPIMVAEKQMCWLRATLRGRGGHGSLPVRGEAMARLGRMLLNLDRRTLPVHITPTVRAMIEGMAGSIGGVVGYVLRQLLNPLFTDALLAAMGEKGRAFAPLLHHTVSPTILHGSSKINVIPTEVAVELDGRLLPGFGVDEFLDELRRICGKGVEFEVVRFDPGPPSPNMARFSVLERILREMDNGAKPLPLLLSGVTDARFFAKLGIQTYGFTPLQLPSDFSFLETVHGPDERVPLEALTFGTNALYRAILEV